MNCEPLTMTTYFSLCNYCSKMSLLICKNAQTNEHLSYVFSVEIYTTHVVGCLALVRVSGAHDSNGHV